MTDSLAPPPPSDEEIAALLQREIGAGVHSLTTLRPGAWSSATAASTTSGDFIVRFAETPDDFYCDANASRFSSDLLPIPTVYGIGQYDERYWCISDRMPGGFLDDLTTEQMERTLPSISRMLIAMREIDDFHTRGFGGWNQHGDGIFPSFADQLLDVGNDIPGARGGGWKQFLARNEYDHRIFEAGLIRLEELCSYLPDDRHLIHEDTINYNVVVQDNQVSGIFDWGTAMWGDAVYDLAWFRFWNPWYPHWVELDIPRYLEREVGIIGKHPEERMQCCLLHIGLMHIRYNAFLGNLEDMNDVARATGNLL